MCQSFSISQFYSSTYTSQFYTHSLHDALPIYPFFVEEVIRMLIERGAIVRSGERWMSNETIHGVEIPDTLYSLLLDRKSTRLNSSHLVISYAVFFLIIKNIDFYRL